MSGHQQNKTLFTILVLALILAGVYYYNANPFEGKNANIETSPVQQDGAQLSVSYNGVEGKTALELLKKNYQVETEHYQDLGEFVTTINGITASSSHFWALYVNGQMSQVGASDYLTKDGDLIEWRLEAIN